MCVCVLGDVSDKGRCDQSSEWEQEKATIQAERYSEHWNIPAAPALTWATQMNSIPLHKSTFNRIYVFTEENWLKLIHRQSKRTSSSVVRKLRLWPTFASEQVELFIGLL